tara:strand:+ start:304 stop:720 length:417 start_codon:yes stop_codon:yes gene_type:complete
MHDLRLFIPLLSGYITSYICPMSDKGANLKARPPAFVFGLVWPILYFSLGYSWLKLKHLKNADLLFALNSFLGCLWLYTYSCNNNKKGALYVILSMLLTSFYLLFFSFKYNPNITYLLIPYSVWLLFALLLNFESVSS